MLTNIQLKEFYYEVHLDTNMIWIANYVAC